MLEAGANGIFDGGLGDDVVVSLTPSFDGNTIVTLGVDSGTLTPGSYQLTIDGDSSIEDLDGNPLNSTTGPGGGSDHVHQFDVQFSVPAGGDLYELALVAGETVSISTSTPFSDASPFRTYNELDPELIVYSPDGQVVASDQNSVDGINAGVQLTAAVDGVYTIAVLAEFGTVGEYLLDVQPADTGEIIDVDIRIVAAPTPDNSSTLPSEISTVTLGDNYFVEVWVQEHDPSFSGISGGASRLVVPDGAVRWRRSLQQGLRRITVGNNL